MKKKSLIIALVAIFCTSCQKDAGSSDFTPKIKSSNITGALALAQVQSMSSKNAGMESPQKILKLTSNNQLSDLIIYMENYEGKEMPCGVVANSIQDLSDDFVLLNNCTFVFPDGFFPDGDYSGLEWISLLLRKSDGAVYKMPHNNFQIMNHTDICSDNKGSIYFLNLSGCVMKLSTNGQDLTIQQITPNEFKYRSLAIDKNGNVAVSASEHSGTDPNNRPITRGGFHSFGHLYFASGGIKELALENAFRGIFSFKGELSSIEYGQNIRVKQLKVVGQDISWEEVASCLIPINVGITIASEDLAIVCNDKFISTNKVRDEVAGEKTMLLIYDGNTLATKIEDKFPDNGYYNNKGYYAVDGFDDVVDIGGETIGKGLIYKYDFQTLSASSITYDVAKIPAMISSKTEVLILDNTCKFLRYGYRSSDVKPIIVEVDAETGEVSVTEYETTQSITTLVRLN